jgi:uridine phosphorylase
MCPVCRARFRGESECSRCGADLTTLMRLQVYAWQLRQTARQAILVGDPARAQTLAARAEKIHHTEPGERLAEFSSWLSECRP